MERIPYPIKPLGTIDVSAGFGTGLAVLTSTPENYNQPYRFHGPEPGEAGGRRSNYSFHATEANQVVLIWFAQAEHDHLKPVQSITCGDLVFQKRTEKNGTSTYSSIFQTGGLIRFEVWWALTSGPMDHPVLTFVLEGGQDTFLTLAGISVFSDFRVPELPWDTSPPDIIFSPVNTTNTARTNYGRVVDNYYFPWGPFDFISYGDAMVGLDTEHPLLIDITTFPSYTIPGFLFFPRSTADNLMWSGLTNIYLIGSMPGRYLQLLTTVSYRRGEPGPLPPSCIPPIPLDIPAVPITPAVITAWTIEPDWINGVTERLLWKTDVLTSQTGFEQRRRLRNAPRRQIDAAFTLIGMDRRLYDSYMVGPAAHVWHYPLWWEKYRLTAPSTAFGTHLTMEDTSYSEVTSGSVLLLRGTLPFIFEVVTVTEISGGSVSLNAPLARDWPKGSTVYLTKLCRLTGQQRGNRRADDAAQVTLTFDTIEPNEHPWFPPSDMGLDFLVLDWLPDEAQDLTTEYKRLIQEFDNQVTSIPIRRDLAGVSFMLQQFSYFVVGRKRLDELRGLLHYLQGKLLPLYVPTYFNDVDLLPGFWGEPDTAILAVSRSGYTEYVNMLPQSRRKLMFLFRDGTMMIRTVVSSAIVSDGQESITVDEPFFRPISNVLVVRICWLALSRQDQDEVEILHHADGTGPTTMTTTFASIEAGRDAQPYTTAVFNGSYVQVVGESPPPTPPPPDGPVPPVTVDQVPLTVGDVGGDHGGDGGGEGNGDGTEGSDGGDDGGGAESGDGADGGSDSGGDTGGAGP